MFWFRSLRHIDAKIFLASARAQSSLNGNWRLPLRGEARRISAASLLKRFAFGELDHQNSRVHENLCISTQFCFSFCASPAWWLLRRDQTRSHPELGRQTRPRQWYSVSRHGRVGRCQACKAQNVLIHNKTAHQSGFSVQKPRRRNRRCAHQI